MCWVLLCCLCILFVFEGYTDRVKSRSGCLCLFRGVFCVGVCDVSVLLLCLFVCGGAG